MSELRNLSIKLAKFPDSCKIVKLKPLFKKGFKTNPLNYRPIPLLPLILQIIEKSFHEQASSFWTNNSILYNYQSGFRKNSHGSSLSGKIWKLLIRIWLTSKTHLFRSFKYYTCGTTGAHFGTITVSHICKWHAPAWNPPPMKIGGGGGGPFYQALGDLKHSPTLGA